MTGWAKAVLAAAVVLGPTGTDATAGLDDVEAGLDRRLVAIETAFRSGDVRLLFSHLPSGSRVRVDIAGLTGAQAFFGPDQVRVVMEGVFARVCTHRFAFAGKTATNDTAFVTSRWIRQDRLTQMQTSHTLIFTIRREAQEWRILEIRSSR
jgi:hypothetical protein